MSTTQLFLEAGQESNLESVGVKTIIPYFEMQEDLMDVEGPSPFETPTPDIVLSDAASLNQLIIRPPRQRLTKRYFKRHPHNEKRAGDKSDTSSVRSEPGSLKTLTERIF